MEACCEIAGGSNAVNALVTLGPRSIQGRKLMVAVVTTVAIGDEIWKAVGTAGDLRGAGPWRVQKENSAVEDGSV